ncbi:MAG: hypothetical protein WBG15_21770, partial [Xanthobacteraceae bacterium]
SAFRLFFLKGGTQGFLAVAWQSSDAEAHRENGEAPPQPSPRARGEGARLDLPERRGFNPMQIKRARYAPYAAKGA